MPRAKRGQQKVPTLKKTTGLFLSRYYYSMVSLKPPKAYAVRKKGGLEIGHGRLKKIR